MTDEDLCIEESLVPPEHEGQWQLENHRCLEECIGKRIMSQNDGRLDLTVDNEKHELWCYVIKKIQERGHCSVATVQKENVMLSSALNAWKRKQSRMNLTNQPQKKAG